MLPEHDIELAFDVKFDIEDITEVCFGVCMCDIMHSEFSFACQALPL